MVAKMKLNRSIRVLGISAFYHDSAACLILNGEIVAAAQEERFSRIKNDKQFPRAACEFCLTEGGVALHEIDAVVFYDKPLLKLERILETYLIFAPRGIRTFIAATVAWMYGKFFFRRMVRTELLALDTKSGNVPILFSEHHLSHAASAFFPSPFQESAILTVDGIGEWATVSIGYGTGSNICMLKEMNFPHSLGLLYSSFTEYLGFEVHLGEQKVMGLAAYADPMSALVQKYQHLIETHLVEIRADGSFVLTLAYFDFPVGTRMTRDKKWHDLFGIARRDPETALSEAHYALARAIQNVTEEILLRMSREAKRITKSETLCLAGGVALNCLANSRIRASNIFEKVWVQPCAGDGGGALGAALAAYHLYFGGKRTPHSPDGMRGAYTGPFFSDTNIQTFLDAHAIRYEKISDVGMLCERAAKFLAEGKTVGWFQGKMEWGPRALGNRSILADPRNPESRSRINEVVKRRELFRPFGPAVLQEDVGAYFTDSFPDPYMLFVTFVQPARRISVQENPSSKQTAFDSSRSDIPAVTHVDYSSRVQTVSRDSNLLFYSLLQAFKSKTGCGVLLNTSFNVRDEPIVCSPIDAYKTFRGSQLDVLVMGSFVIVQ